VLLEVSAKETVPFAEPLAVNSAPASELCLVPGWAGGVHLGVGRREEGRPAAQGLVGRFRYVVLPAPLIRRAR
jgi:hypothetical protein